MSPCQYQWQLAVPTFHDDLLFFVYIIFVLSSIVSHVQERVTLSRQYTESDNIRCRSRSDQILTLHLTKYLNMLSASSLWGVFYIKYFSFLTTVQSKQWCVSIRSRYNLWFCLRNRAQYSNYTIVSVPRSSTSRSVYIKSTSVGQIKHAFLIQIFGSYL